ncbi:MAG TPA: hypothetical protein VIY47_01345 [Ignavibacteriaceae bacterium]
MNSIIFTFCRANPPTRGHERLISKVVETARNLNADHAVYLSHTHKSPTDPLDWKFKRRVCEAAFPGVNISKDERIRNPFHALEHFAGLYENVTLVVGSDRIEEFKNGMTKYVEAYGYNFNIVSAGDRIAESRGIAGLSSSKLKKYAAEGNMEKFFAGLPSLLNENIKELVYKNTRRGLR